jgi:hypothetical protein
MTGRQQKPVDFDPAIRQEILVEKPQPILKVPLGTKY